MNRQEDKIRVLQVVSGISTEGIGTFVLNTYENIDKQKVDMSFALATDWTQHHEQRILNQGGLVYRTAEIGRGIRGIFAHFIHLIKLLKQQGPFDVVHSHMDFFNGINSLAAFIAGVPVRISHAHLAADKSQLSLPKKLYNAAMKICIYAFATHRLGCSKLANEYMNDIRFFRRDSEVLLNGIDVKRFSKAGKQRNAAAGAEAGAINFVTVGRIDEQKNPFFIVNIMKELRDIDPRVHLYWAGSGSLEKEVKYLMNEYHLHDTISLLGVRNDIAEVFANMDYLLFPSKWEGLPIVLLEAQTSGIPCFISDTITTEVDVGLCTVLSLREDEKAWAQQIYEHIQKKSYNAAVNEDKLKQFDIQRIAGKLERLYQEARGKVV